MPKTQKQLAQQIAVSEVVLSEWKDRETFDEDIKRARLNLARSLTPEVINALYRRASGNMEGGGKNFKGGKAADVKLWIDLFKPGWNKKE